MGHRIHLPHDDHDCGWYAVLPERAPAQVLRGEIHCDYAVLGAGFVGLAAARRLAELRPEAKIVLVDAQRVGQGASGRNSGFVIDLPHKFALEHPDPEYKRRLLALNRAAITQLQDLIERHKIDCQWSHAGKYQGAVGPRGLKYLDHFERLLGHLGEPFRRVEGDELAQRLGTRHYTRAIFTPGGYLMQPAALVVGLARSLPANVEVLEDSPIRRFESRTNGWTLHGDAGCIKASAVFFGSNIFTREFGFLKHRLLPVMTFASWTRPLTDTEMQRYGGTLDWGLTPADHAGTTLRMTQDRRILVRNTYQHVPRYGKSVSDAMRNKIRAAHWRALNTRWPQLAEVPITHTWGGTYAMSRNFSNFFGKLREQLYASACDNGVGVAWGTISGTLLADFALGETSQALADIQAVTGMPALNPPEPFLGLGVRTRIALAAWNSRSEL